MSDNHDPLCWTEDMGGIKRATPESCAVCALIARVRAEYVNPDCVWGEGECIPGCPSCKRHDDSYADWCNGHRAGYADGVADERVQARQRVEALPGRANGAWLLWSDAVAAAGGDAA